MRRRLSLALLANLLALPLASAQDREPSPAGAWFAEPRPMATGLDLATRYVVGVGEPVRDGFYPMLGGMVTGAGWISIGPGYRKHLFDGAALVDASAAISWRGYKKAHATFELPRLARGKMTIGAQLLWQDLTQLQYFGRGPSSLKAARSDYRLTTTDVVGYAAYQPTPWFTVEARLGRLTRPAISSSTGPFDRDLPDAHTTFSDDPGFAPDERPVYIHGELAAAVDTRDYPDHPRRGGFYRAAWSAYSDRDRGAFSFDRYELEAMQFVPIRPDVWTLAFHGWSTFSTTAGGHRVPAYMLPALGGPSSLRSFADYRFRDRNLLLLSAESRWALFPRVDVALFADAGGVAERVRDLRLARASSGAGVRLHLRRSTVARLDVARGGEGWRVLFRLNEVFRPSRLSRRTAAIPFVP